jgi:hypothetical protein
MSLETLARNPAATAAPRFWIVGGRYVDDGRHLPWPRVYGPFPDRAAAQAALAGLDAEADPAVRYDLLCDVEA